MTTTQHVQRDTARAVAALPERAVSDVVMIGSDGNAVTWEEIMRQYGNLVFTTVRSFRLQDADARDAVQTTWLRLAENAHRVQWSERLAGWLTTTARRECLRILRQTKRIPVPVDTVDDTVVHPSAGPEQLLIDVDAARTLWKLVEELPPRQRTLLRVLFADHPRPYAEVARDAGIPTGAIGPTRARALRQLRRRLDEHGLGPAA
jgi:RNA polymerase sigma factor (sigma-70 family)